MTARAVTTLAVLDTPRLRLSSPTSDDADGIAAYARDPEVSRYVSWRRHRSIADAHAFLEHAMAAVEKGTELHWVITQRTSKHLLGTIALGLQAHRAELGYVLARQYGRSATSKTPHRCTCLRRSGCSGKDSSEPGRSCRTSARHLAIVGATHE